MIRIKIIAGPHAGKEREIADGQCGGIDIDPAALLDECIAAGARWKINYSRASESEAFEWGRADLVARITRALLENRPVEFQGTVYRADSLERVTELAGIIEDAIVYSGYNVTIARDDESGVFIEAVSREHPLQ